jgi:hypothetical protein|tara:strand:+ start:65 stop:373 length:309 start_codon:yes stop_codon:yes gene_type:complete
MKIKDTNVINPIQPMYNSTQADQERQRSMMMGQQQQRKPKDKPMTMGMSKGGKLKDVPTENTGLSKLPTGVRNKMGFKNRGGIINNGKSDYRKSGMFYKGDK